MNALASTTHDDDEGEMLPLGVVLALAVLARIEADAEAAKRRALVALGADIRSCRRCGCDVAKLPHTSHVLTLSTGADHIEACPGIDDEERARLRALNLSRS